MGTDNSRKRRRYGADLKARILTECAVPGASVAKVAMAHGINANIVHGWRKLAREGRVAASSAAPAFIPVAVEPKVIEPQPREPHHVEIELRRGSVSMKLAWPASAAAELAVWTRELLK